MTQTVDFLRCLYPRPFPVGQLVIWTRPLSGGSRSHWVDCPEQAVSLVERYRGSRHVYFGVALQDPEKARQEARRKRGGSIPCLSTVRGSTASAVVLPGVWVDLDVAGDGHRSRNLPPTRDAALGLLAAVPLEPSIVVATGGGFHVYWLFEEPWILDADESCAQAGGLVRQVQDAVRQRARQQGWTVDPTADLARVLRLPGTLNHKTRPPKEVTLEVLRPGCYQVADFDVVQSAAGVARSPESRRAPGSLRGRLSSPVAGPGMPRGSGPPADFQRILDRCSWLKHCHEDRETLREPEWYAALSIVGRAARGDDDGRTLAHEMSVGYLRYTPEETDAKLDQALRAAGARTCDYIAGELNTEVDYCGACPHRGHVKSPIMLGRGRDPMAVPSSAQGEPSQRPRIVVSHREDQVCDQVLSALAARQSNLFRRGGVLVQTVPADDGEASRPLHRPAAAPRVREVAEPRLRELMSRHCDFVKVCEGKAGVELKPAHPPQWAARAILHRHAWPELPRLEGLVEGPVLTAGGVLQTPGHDRTSGLYYLPGRRFRPVPARPSAADVKRSLAALREVVADFPFASGAHRAAWLASLLTPLARFAFRGPSPLNVIDANVRGAGKSLLAEITHAIVTGRPAARMPYVRDESELRKSVTSIALEAAQMILIDNVVGVFGSPTLDLVLTGVCWRDRLLGGNRHLELPLFVTWYVTGNNLVLRGDTPRRAIYVRLESPDERPEERTGFRHPDLLAWVEAERGRLLPAALTLLAAFDAAGRPDQRLPAFGSYEGWSALVRSCVVWLGLDDPAATRRQLPATADAEDVALAGLVRGLEELLAELGGAATARCLVLALAEPGNAERFTALRAVLEELFPRLKAGELPTPAQLGFKLRSLRGRVIDGASIRGKKTNAGIVWRVKS